MKKIAYLGATPAYYFIPFIKQLSNKKDIDLTVYWGTNETTRPYVEKEFGTKVKPIEGLLDGYKYKICPNLIGKAAYQSGFFGLNSFFFYKEFFKLKYDVLIVHGWQYLNNFNAILAAKIVGTKVFMRCETPLNQELLLPKLKLLFKSFCLRLFFYIFIDRFLYIGKENKKFYLFNGVKRNKLFFSPYGIDTEKFISYQKNKSYLREDFRRQNGILDDEVLILYVGKLIEKKRPELLIKAFNGLNIKKAKLFLIGTGCLETKLKEYVITNNVEKVSFIGYKSQDEILKYYLMADIFVLPSGMRETFPLVVCEAIAFGLPTILSNRIGSSTDFASSKNGFTFKYDSINDFINALTTLVKDQFLRSSLSYGSLKLSEKYSTKNTVMGIISALNSLT